MKNIFNKNGNSSSTSTIISLSLVLFVVGLLAFVLINANKVSDKMKESIVFSIMLYDSTDDTSEELIFNQRAEFNNYLDGSEYFLDVTFIDKEIAFANLQEDMGEDFSSVLGSNPLLDSYDAYVKAEFVSPNGLKEIEDFINTFKGSDVVQDIFYQRNLVEKLNSNVKNISLFLLAFCVVFFLISFALINNTIRLSIYSKRLLIRTMRLVGATNMFIQKPYLISSVYQGFFSSVVAIFMLIGSLEIIKKQIPELIQTNDFLEIAVIFGLILIFGIIISWISTFFAIRKYLNLNENKLFN
ncbi:MAG: cell division protein FtsX [Flavobacteriales bacterium]